MVHRIVDAAAQGHLKSVVDHLYLENGPTTTIEAAVLEAAVTAAVKENTRNSKAVVKLLLLHREHTIATHSAALRAAAETNNVAMVAMILAYSKATCGVEAVISHCDEVGRTALIQATFFESASRVSCATPSPIIL